MGDRRQALGRYRLGKFEIKKTENQVIEPCLNSVAFNRLKFMRQRRNFEDVKVSKLDMRKV